MQIPRRTQAGFTLTELLITIVIIGLIAGSYIHRNYTKLRSPAETVTAASVQAQIENVYANWVTAGGSHYDWTTLLANDGDPADAQARAAKSILSVLTAPAGSDAIGWRNSITGAADNISATSQPPASNTIRTNLRVSVNLSVDNFGNTATALVPLSGTTETFYVLFKPTSQTSGKWQVTVASVPATVIP